MLRPPNTCHTYDQPNKRGPVRSRAQPRRLRRRDQLPQPKDWDFDHDQPTHTTPRTDSRFSPPRDCGDRQRRSKQAARRRQTCRARLRSSRRAGIAVVERDAIAGAHPPALARFRILGAGDDKEAGEPMANKILAPGLRHPSIPS